MPLSPNQVQHLLAPIHPSRILKVKKGTANLSYVAQHDIRAHLIRMFGFGGWSTDVLSTEFVYDHCTDDARPKWTACYRATVKLTIYAEDGTEVAHYTDSHASGCMPQPDRADAHALALTTAVSTAMKRAATCLGDQFGLSLYNKGQTKPFVIATIVGEKGSVAAAEVTAMGDEDDQADVDTQTGEITPPALPDPEVEAWLTELRSYATEPDNTERITAVAGLKITGKGILGETTVVQGQTMTLARVADLVAQGSFLPDPTDKDI